MSVRLARAGGCATPVVAQSLEPSRRFAGHCAKLASGAILRPGAAADYSATASGPQEQYTIHKSRLQAQLVRSGRGHLASEDGISFREPEALDEGVCDEVEVNRASVPPARWVGEQFRLGKRNCHVVL